MSTSMIDYIAESFVTARRRATALMAFPGKVPSDLATGYACQDRAITLWPDHIVGWKVGYIAPDRRDASGDDRVTGPIFSRSLWHDTTNHVLDLPLFVGGFAAVEAEYVLVLGRDAPADKLRWTSADAASLVAGLHIGVESAGSPLASINQLGPSVVATDFGNNAGLILGREIPEWQTQPDDVMKWETWIEGECVGRGGVSSIPGGLLEALAFALGRCARRGLPLKAGALVTTGAATGIHDLRVGQTATLSFGKWGSIQCRGVPAVAMTSNNASGDAG
jgi:2-keto-4-pentenoate hydratase